MDERVLAQWAALFDEPGTPALQARLLRPIVEEHLEAIAILAEYPVRMAATGYLWTAGWHEKSSIDDGTVRWETARVDSWDEAILQGPHFFVSTPFYKEPNQPCRSNLDYSQWDLEQLPDSVIPRTNYQRAVDRGRYTSAVPIWWGKPAPEHWRLGWRKMTHPSLQRSLIAAVFPQGALHVGGVQTLALPDVERTLLCVGLWSSLPLDFVVKVSGKANIYADSVDVLPAPQEHPASADMLLRVLRLNCLTQEYAQLWNGLSAGRRDSLGWTKPFAHLVDLRHAGTWERSTPLRRDEERRAALVEIDALAALMLGLSADHLVSIYTGQMAVLRKYEFGMWFDANGRVIAKDNAAKGAKQQDQDFGNLQAYLAGEPCGDLLERYTPPFRQPDREAEMRASYAEFKDRLGL